MGASKEGGGGTGSGERQLEMFVPTHALASGPTHVCYERLNPLLREADVDGWLEALCADFYARGGRPSIPPGA